LQAGAVAGVRFLVAHGTEDEIVPFEQGQALAQALGDATDNGGGESFLRVHWVAVPKALRARHCVNRRR
jgi:predicted esterase